MATCINYMYIYKEFTPIYIYMQLTYTVLVYIIYICRSNRRSFFMTNHDHPGSSWFKTIVARGYMYTCHSIDSRLQINV